MPPPTIQYSPIEIRAASLLHDGQFRGSFFESSGCGSRIIVPSVVFFFPSDNDRRGIGFREAMLGCEGKEELDVVAGVLCRPRGLFVSLERRRTEPGVGVSIWFLFVESQTNQGLRVYEDHSVFPCSISAAS